MATFDPQIKQTSDACVPTVPCELPSTQQECEGTIDGHITGKIMMPCCCPRLYTRTFVLDIGPLAETALTAFKQNTVTAWEAANYLVLAHSTEDTGAGSRLGLTIGWYA